MTVKTVYPTDLIRFITDINATSNGTLPFNDYNADKPFESTFDPTFQISGLASQFLLDVERNNIREANTELEAQGLPVLFLDTDLESDNKRIYRLCQAIVLEATALAHYYYFDYRRLQYFPPSFFKVVRENTKYVADYFGDYEEYRHFIPRMRKLDLSFGYMENQIKRVSIEGVRRTYGRF